MTYCDFLFEKFAGSMTREKMSKYWKYLYMVNIAAFVVWGVFTATQVFSSQTCKDTSKNVYRLSFLLSCIFFVFGGFLILGGCAGFLDYCLASRFRIVLIKQKDEDEDDDE